MTYIYFCIHIAYHPSPSVAVTDSAGFSPLKASKGIVRCILCDVKKYRCTKCSKPTVYWVSGFGVVSSYSVVPGVGALFLAIVVTVHLSHLFGRILTLTKCAFPFIARWAWVDVWAQAESFLGFGQDLKMSSRRSNFSGDILVVCTQFGRSNLEQVGGFPSKERT